ncbi:MAG: right-handed parallel beta-helix repeat-containing protein [Vogesella sp.]|uniref:right-handed parallel beta-helix repeat-containing protein n=1 Tax=Vogesella sp. TaxID=1904252 RepID=UPI00391A9406
MSKCWIWFFLVLSYQSFADCLPAASFRFDTEKNTDISKDIAKVISDANANHIQLYFGPGHFKFIRSVELKSDDCLKTIDISGSGNGKTIIEGWVYSKALNEIYSSVIKVDNLDYFPEYYRPPLKKAPVSLNFISSTGFFYPHALSGDDFLHVSKVGNDKIGSYVVFHKFYPEATGKIGNIFIHGFFGNQWRDEYIKVSQIVGDKFYLKRNPHYGLKSAARVKLVEFPSGGWSDHLRNGEINTKAIVANGFFQFKDLNSVSISDLSFVGTNGNALHFYNIDKLNIRNLNISHVALDAIKAEKSKYGFIARNRIHTVGGSGIDVESGDRIQLKGYGFLIADNEISRVGEIYKTANPAIRINGVGVDVKKNFISDVPHSAIMFQGNDHFIGSNVIEKAVQSTGDAGVIYTGRDWAGQGTRIIENKIKDSRGVAPYFATAIYIDDQASGITAERNLIDNVYRAFLIGGGRSNMLLGNKAYNCKEGIHADDRGLTWQKSRTQDSSWDLMRRLLSVPYQSEAYRKYKKLYELLDDELGAPKYNTIQDNDLLCERPFMFYGSFSRYVELR